MSSVRRRAPLASIIIPCWNGWRHTRECLASVARCTPEPHEVILIDNGSRDATARLKARPRGVSPLRVIRNAENRGFAAAINQGVRLARGRHVVWLNNDVVATPGWLSGLAACADSSPRAGAAGPSTNAIAGGGIQQVAHAGYRGAAGLDLFAAAWSRGGAPRAKKVKCLSGFCLLVKRSAMRRAGPLDERFRFGGYEDLDYCLRLRAAGYGLLFAGRVFVHHHGHRSFVANAVSAKTVEKNLRLFLEKWGARGLDRLGYRPRSSSSRICR